MATEEKIDPQLERQRATVQEVGNDPADIDHPSEVPSAPMRR